MSATLRVSREGLGIELRRGTFEVAVDGTPVATIERHETVEVPVEPGPHSLRIRTGRYGSPNRAFEAAEGQIVAFRCHGAMIWSRYLVSLLVPDLAVSLRRE